MNPLLAHHKLPPFEAIQPEHIVPAIEQHIATARDQTYALLEQHSDYNWENTLQVLEALEDDIEQAWAAVRHLHAVVNNEPLRAAYQSCVKKLSDYATEMGQNKALYQAYQTIKARADFPSLSAAQQKTIDNALRDFRLCGVALPSSDKARYKKIQQSLSQLEIRFSNNVLDATQAWQKQVEDIDLLSGLPESALKLAEHTAKKAGMSGYLFTLEFPSYMPLMQYADNAALRKEAYHAYVTRASADFPAGSQWDNTDLIQEILQHRAEKATLLGFDSYAHLSLASKMVERPEEVLAFLATLASRTRPHAEAELQALTEFARAETGQEILHAWDIAYFTEKLRAHRFQFSQEALRPYFPVPQVLNGLFAVSERLYGLTIEEITGIETWHSDVRFFEVYDADHQLRGSFYLDLYARTNKQGGAWMDECRVRRKHAGTVQLPVAYLTCNFIPPVNGELARLNHDEVITLFHEFGHTLHHLLTQVDYAGVSGIRGVPWDAVELPSQLMENWCWEPQALALFGRHIETDEPITIAMIEKIRAAKNFNAGLQMLRQLEFALFDFKLHLDYRDTVPIDPHALLTEVREQVAVIHPPAFNRFENSFTHIFSGGYAAGYYSYKWAEILSADAYSRYAADPFDRTVSEQFLHGILEQGGSRDIRQSFIQFMGREPDVESLLQQSGLA